MSTAEGFVSQVVERIEMRNHMIISHDEQNIVFEDLLMHFDLSYIAMCNIETNEKQKRVSVSYYGT